MIPSNQKSTRLKKQNITTLLYYLLLAVVFLVLWLLPPIWALIPAVLLALNSVINAYFAYKESTPSNKPSLLINDTDNNVDSKKPQRKVITHLETYASILLAISTVLLAIGWFIFQGADLPLLSTFGIFGVMLGSLLSFIDAVIKLRTEFNLQNGIKTLVLFLVTASLITLGMFFQFSSAIIFTSIGLATGTLPFILVLIAIIAIGLAFMAHLIPIITNKIRTTSEQPESTNQDIPLSEQPAAPPPITKIILWGPQDRSNVGLKAFAIRAVQGKYDSQATKYSQSTQYYIKNYVENGVNKLLYLSLIPGLDYSRDSQKISQSTSETVTVILYFISLNDKDFAKLQTKASAEIAQLAEHNPEIPIFIVGTMSDKPDRTQDRQIIDLVAKDLSAQGLSQVKGCFITSAQNDTFTYFDKTSTDVSKPSGSGKLSEILPYIKEVMPTPTDPSIQNNRVTNSSPISPSPQPNSNDNG
jgi:hypothetical protein